MAKKSKTQRAKASANRAAKKERAAEVEVEEIVEEQPKKRFGFSKKDSKEAPKNNPAPQQHKKQAKKKRKLNIGFLNDVVAEMRRVTWPSKQEVAQWSGVVVVALLFFGIYVVILDDWIVTPILLAISSLGA